VTDAMKIINKCVWI